MSRKCKCQVCGKELTTDIAFKVTKGKVNKYYCNEKEYKDYRDNVEARKNIYSLCCQLANSENTIINKEISNLGKIYKNVLINEFLKVNYKTLEEIMSRCKNGNDYGRIKYLFTVIKNKIGDFKYEVKEEIVVNFDLDFYESNYKPKKKKKKTLLEYEAEV